MENFHCEHAKDVLKQMPTEQVCIDVADFFKIFADSSRIKILFAMKDKEICVHDISQIVGISQSAVSHQLKTLRYHKVVKIRRDKKKLFYSLDDSHIHSVITQGLEHLKHTIGEKND